MARCKGCGKYGLFLVINEDGLCDNCYHEKQLNELNDRARIWDQRVEELSIDLNSPIVHLDRGNSSFVGLHVWRENNQFCFFNLKPTMDTKDDEIYLYPEHLFIMRETPLTCYRVGKEGVRYETDYSEVEAKITASKYQTGMDSIASLLAARNAARFAPTTKIHYDNRRTVLNTLSGPLKFSIDDYTLFHELFPEICDLGRTTPIPIDPQPSQTNNKQPDTSEDNFPTIGQIYDKLFK